MSVCLSVCRVELLKYTGWYACRVRLNGYDSSTLRTCIDRDLAAHGERAVSVEQRATRQDPPMTLPSSVLFCSGTVSLPHTTQQT